nr:uncharacterized protein LOC117680953 [Crassostrea gigas]
MEIVTQKPNTQKGTVKETFVKAADLVSLVAQGMCAFCCQVTGREEERYEWLRVTGTFFTEVSSNGIPQGSFDPVNAVKQTMSKTSLEINPIRITQQFSSDPGFFKGHNPMQSMQQGREDQSATSTAFGSMGPMQSFQHMSSSQSSFNGNAMQPLQSMRQTVSHSSVNMDKMIDPVQSVQHSFFNHPPTCQISEQRRVSAGSNTNRE